MPTVVGNMVKETTTTTGTGTIDLDGAPTGFQGFADEFTSGAQVPYTLVDDPDNPNAWEVGLGTFTAGTPNTLSRDTVYDSSASGSKITLSGTTTVISTPLAAQTTVKDGDNTLTGANTFNGPLVAGPGTELTISSGSITPTGNYHTVDTEADAGNDNLDSIVVTNVPDGGYLLLRGESPTSSPARVVTVRSGISPGNITLQGGFSFVMDTAEARILLQRNGSIFEEVARSIIADNSVTGAKIAMGSDAQGDVLYHDGTDYARLAAGTNRYFLQTQGAGANPQWGQPLTPQTAQQATGTETEFDFTSLPAGINRITITFFGVSLTGTDDILVQIGDSGGIEATGYVSSSIRADDDAAGGGTSSTSGFAVYAAAAAIALSGQMILTRSSTTVWVSSSNFYRTSNTAVFGGGHKTLSGTLDRVRITRTGTDTFDGGGVINVLVE